MKLSSLELWHEVHRYETLASGMPAPLLQEPSGLNLRSLDGPEVMRSCAEGAEV